LLAQAAVQMNVQQLADFVRSELALHHQSDKKLGDYIRKIQLTEKLTDKTILDLQAQGAGPDTVKALQYLRDQTASLKPPSRDATYSPATAPDNSLSTAPATVTLGAKAPPIPPPDSVRQQQILDRMREYALSYNANLPNFICVEVVRRTVDPRGTDRYMSLDTILAKVSYNEGREQYKVYSVGGKFVETPMEKVGGGGARSTGEFAGMMRSIFEPASQAEFNWDHWGTLRGRRMAVFSYFIDSGHSSYSISYESGPGDDQRIVTAYRGRIYADEYTGEIDRIEFIAIDIPKSFPVSETTEILDYDQVDISGKQYVVPLIAQLYMVAGHQKSKNRIEFRDYRKFGTESVITYDTKAPAPLPSSETEEQPATSKPSPDSRQQAAKPNAASSSPNPFALPIPPPPRPPPQ
jgi:hypothetical protein